MTESKISHRCQSHGQDTEHKKTGLAYGEQIQFSPEREGAFNFLTISLSISLVEKKCYRMWPESPRYLYRE